MTVKQLIEKLEALPEEQKEMPVKAYDTKRENYFPACNPYYSEWFKGIVIYEE